MVRLDQHILWEKRTDAKIENLDVCFILWGCMLNVLGGGHGRRGLWSRNQFIEETNNQRRLRVKDLTGSCFHTFSAFELNFRTRILIRENSVCSHRDLC